MTAELALAIIGVIDLALKYGKELRKICSSLKGAESEIQERSIRLDNGCYRCIAQLQFLKQVQHILDDGHRELQERTLRVLIEKLTSAKSVLRSLVSTQVSTSECGSSRVVFIPKAVKYAFRKDRLDEAIEALETWQRLSDPSWFLIFKISDPRIEEVLKMKGSLPPSSRSSITSIRAPWTTDESAATSIQGLVLPSEALEKMSISEVPYSCCSLAQNKTSGKASSYVLESIKLQHHELYQHTKKDVRNLAMRLQHDEPQTFGLLACKGFVAERPDPERGTPARFTLVLRTPSQLVKPRSLRHLLLNSQPESLSHKLRAAQELAKAVAYVHVFGFVHKGIRPESILSFESEQKSGETSLFLVGFEDFRQEYGQTKRLGDDVAERNLYRHPSRQGASPSSDFVMQHDIYSLGVCLLEIGLWQSFIEYDRGGLHPKISPVLGQPETDKA
ncbi:hypothetical protein F5B22DRAFT_204059 [Xylaria bambusicola]|uniref:uncharacterized protein n=1 Tax=Xylaria bambusicola TaxID=326684 RepID=UPI002007C344|nr:uncharacterized protein F5B22DRAFT_204059 [Xylaria bambusicola]KAI0515147.1 hypothetical protein F5B22DRAFT_204059 [Xylaria bambusicola]